MKELRLERLVCSQCGAPVAAERDDVVFYCTACRSGFRLASGVDGQELPGLIPVEVYFVSAPGVAARRHLPFWWLPATVTIDLRKAAGVQVSGLLKLFWNSAEESPAEPGTPTEGSFAIPAFSLPITKAAELAWRYTEALPRLGERLGEKLIGGVLSVEDAEKLAHFTLIASEANKPDTLSQLAFSIRFGPARLLGVPFVAKGDGLADGIFGIGV